MEATTLAHYKPAGWRPRPMSLPATKFLEKINNNTMKGQNTQIWGDYCQNCGYESHCGVPKYRDERNWKDERLGEIEVCKSCRCINCYKDNAE